MTKRSCRLITEEEYKEYQKLKYEKSVYIINEALTACKDFIHDSITFEDLYLKIRTLYKKLNPNSENNDD